MTTIPTLEDILDARDAVYRFLNPTALYSYPGINQLVGTRVWVKHENHQPVGAFKVRGGVYMASLLTEAEKKAGLYTASTGNHGQSIAFAAGLYGIRATIAVPEVANPGKVAAMKALGATIIHHGNDFDEAREWAQTEANNKGGKFIGPTDYELVKGVGTYGLEIMESLPEVDTIIVPVGAGSGVCGTSIVAKTLKPEVEIIAVQSAQAPTQQKSWQAGHAVTAPMTSVAEGLATRVAFENTQKIMRQYVDQFILAEDEDIQKAVFYYLIHTHNLVEEAGAAALAAALQLKDQLRNRNVVVVLSGGNLSTRNLAEILQKYREH